MKITLDQIRSLDAIAREGSFAAAARSLNKAQSAVSYDVRQLEQHLDIALFDRTGHRAALTDEGHALLEEGRLLLARARGMESLALRFREGWEPSLQIVIDGIMPMEPIMRALKVMADRGVPTQLTTRVEFLGGVQYRFEKSRADIMLVKDFDKHPGQRVLTLPPLESILVASADHPLSRPGKTRTRADLQAHIQLAVQDSSGRTESLDPYLFGGSRVYYLSDFYTKHRALMLALGFGWMPNHLIENDLAKGRLHEIDLDEPTRYTFTPFMVHPVDQPLGKAGHLFLQLMLESYPEPAGSDG